ncbi:MAG: hypothetical protein RLZZ629_395 [Actinomycetota bacterium]
MSGTTILTHMQVYLAWEKTHQSGKFWETQQPNSMMHSSLLSLIGLMLIPFMLQLHNKV